jgi:hypothetical protein
MSKLLVLLSVMPCCAASISVSISLDTGTTSGLTQPGNIALAALTPTDSFNVTATVDFGSYDLEANANCGNTTVCGSAGSVSFADSITILDASGIIQANTGIATAHFEGLANSGFSFGAFHGQLLGSTYFGDICPCSQAFIAGQTIAFSGAGDVMAHDVAPLDPALGSDTDIAKLKFSFTVLGATGFHYTSESGRDYGIAGGVFVAPVPVPEPEYGVLAVLLMGVGIRYLRSRRHECGGWLPRLGE